MKLMVQHGDGLHFLVTMGEHADKKHSTVAVGAASENGGGSIAFSLPELFAAAMGACILEFVVNSCRLRDMQIEEVSLKMTCEEQERPRCVKVMEATLHIEPEPPKDVQQRLIKVAKHATLANTLARLPEVAIHFAKE
jgi:uncharacterized OsmC-like protein